jgi:hypothetical protein
MHPFQPSDEFGIEREASEPETGLAQLGPSDLARCSTGFASVFEARFIGTSEGVRGQNRCLVPGRAKSVSMTLQLLATPLAPAELAALALAIDRTLTDEAAATEVTIEARRGAERRP